MEGSVGRGLQLQKSDPVNKKQVRSVMGSNCKNRILVEKNFISGNEVSTDIRYLRRTWRRSRFGAGDRGVWARMRLPYTGIAQTRASVFSHRFGAKW